MERVIDCSTKPKISSLSAKTQIPLIIEHDEVIQKPCDPKKSVETEKKNINSQKDTSKGAWQAALFFGGGASYYVSTSIIEKLESIGYAASAVFAYVWLKYGIPRDMAEQLLTLARDGGSLAMIAGAIWWMSS